MKIKAILFVFYIMVNAVSISNISNTTAMGSWVELGSAKVNHISKNGGVKIKQPSENFKKLKITTRDNALSVSKITITYDKGDAQVLEDRIEIAKNGESSIIAINGTGRKIKRIDFSIDSSEFVKGTAAINFFVRK